LARTAEFNLQQAPANSLDEFGVTGTVLFKNFITGETISVIPISYHELRRLTEQDGQARALLSLITMPIKAAIWDVFDPAEDDARNKKGLKGSKQNLSLGVKSSDERDFIHNNLFTPPSEGGMSVSWNKIVAQMSLAVRDGFKVFEKCWKLDDRGRKVVKKLALRQNDTVSLMVDATGDFNGFHQRAFFAGQMVNVIIPKEKSLLFVFGFEDNNLYGAPVFLPVYYHYDKKQKLYYISQVAYQNLAIPPRAVVTPSGQGMTPVTEKIMKEAATLGFNAVIRMPEGYEINPFESKRALADFLPLIDHHNNQMAKSVLGSFIDLTRSGTGKLTAEQADIFVLSLQATIADMEDTINYHLIPELIDDNFGTKRYPKLRARAFTDRQQEMVQSVFEKIMTAGADKDSPEFYVALEQSMADQLNLDGLDYTKIGPDFVKNKKDAQAKALQPAQPPNTNAGGGSPAAGRPTQPGRGFGKEGNQ
jgi:hypothetical protein